jgi:hypothetical protein
VPVISYSEILRAIGQDLELRGMKTFDVRNEGPNVLVQCGYQEPPAPMPVTLQYTPADIDELQLAGEKRRGQSSTAQDFYTLSQTLRAIGGYVEQKKGRLLRISNDHSTGADVVFRIEYEMEDGERMTDVYSSSAIYDICVSMYKHRGKFSQKRDKYKRWRG